MRAAALKASGETLDELAGLPTRYVAKLIGPKPVRRIGLASLGPLSGALLVKYLMVVDVDAQKRFGSRITKRNEACVRDGVLHVTLTRRSMRKIGIKGGKARWKG